MFEEWEFKEETTVETVECDGLFTVTETDRLGYGLKLGYGQVYSTTTLFVWIQIPNPMATFSVQNMFALHRLGLGSLFPISV